MQRLFDRLSLVSRALILIGVDGSHFLWKMVRRMVGVLVEIWRGAMKPSDAAELLAAADIACTAADDTAQEPFRELLDPATM